jgi:hypothetical protein
VDCTGVSIDSAGAGLVFGRVYAGTPGYYFDGYMDQIRVVKGTARWTADFDGSLPLDPQ